jgi:hypothetical protein
LGHACVSGTTAPGNPNQFPQRNCDTNIVANSATSCAFAENAFYEYYLVPEPSHDGQTLRVHSPTTGKNYSLFCSGGGALIACVGEPLATGIYLSFPQAAVDGYTQAAAASYASSHDVGNISTAPPTPAPSSTSGAEGDFCSSHSCIDSFDDGTGYIVQCADGEWSHSGGRPGACSDHGGETDKTYP